MASLSNKGHRPSGTISEDWEHAYNAKKNRRECPEGERPSEPFVGEGERPKESCGGDEKRSSNFFVREGKKLNTTCEGERNNS